MIIFSVVVFPAPLGPSNPNTSPLSTANVTLRTATFVESLAFLQRPWERLPRFLNSFRKFSTYATGTCYSRERAMFYLTMHTTHFIYGYMASDIWLRTTQIVRKEICCRHMDYSFRLAGRILLYASSHRQDNTYHGLCYTSHGALAGTTVTIICNTIIESKKKKFKKKTSLKANIWQWYRIGKYISNQPDQY